MIYNLSIFAKYSSHTSVKKFFRSKEIKRMFGNFLPPLYTFYKVRLLTQKLDLGGVPRGIVIQEEC